MILLVLLTFILPNELKVIPFQHPTNNWSSCLTSHVHLHAKWVFLHFLMPNNEEIDGKDFFETFLAIDNWDRVTLS